VPHNVNIINLSKVAKRMETVHFEVKFSKVDTVD